MPPTPQNTPKTVPAAPLPAAASVVATTPDEVDRQRQQIAAQEAQIEAQRRELAELRQMVEQLTRPAPAPAQTPAAPPVAPAPEPRAHGWVVVNNTGNAPITLTDKRPTGAGGAGYTVDRYPLAVGANLVPLDVWERAQAHPVVAHALKTPAIPLVGHHPRSEPNLVDMGRLDDRGFDGAPEDRALAIVGATLDLARLDGWAQTDARAVVRQAAHIRREELLKAGTRVRAA